jgi:hypothetical protein
MISLWLGYSISCSGLHHLKFPFSSPAPHPPPLVYCGSVASHWLTTSVMSESLVAKHGECVVWCASFPFPLSSRRCLFSLSRTQCGHTGQAHLLGPGKSGEGLSRRYPAWKCLSAKCWQSAVGKEVVCLCPPHCFPHRCNVLTGYHQMPVKGASWSCGLHCTAIKRE